MLAGLVSAIILGIIVGIILAKDTGDHDIALDKNIRDKIRELPTLYSHAQKSIKIATDLDPRFFNDENVKDALNVAIGNGVNVQILSDSEVPPWYLNHESIQLKQVPKLPCHIMVVDDLHIRLEKPHPPLQFGEHKGDAALIFKDFPELASKFSKDFERLWMKAP